jgi:hypothetical protein
MLSLVRISKYPRPCYALHHVLPVFHLFRATLVSSDVILVSQWLMLTHFETYPPTQRMTSYWRSQPRFGKIQTLRQRRSSAAHFASPRRLRFNAWKSSPNLRLSGQLVAQLPRSFLTWIQIMIQSTRRRGCHSIQSIILSRTPYVILFFIFIHPEIIINRYRTTNHGRVTAPVRQTTIPWCSSIPGSRQLNVVGLA